MKRTRGFTLIELAIVLVIVTILIGGLAVPLSAQIQARRIAETKQTLHEAREALIGYAMTNTNASGQSYLPCPNRNGDGKEGLRELGDKCVETEGYLPWVTLGTAAQDAWGNRLLYSVTENFAKKNTGLQNTDLGDRQICSTSSNTDPPNDCAALKYVAGNVPVVILSHGPNGWGAHSINDTNLAPPPTTSTDERENTNGDKKFVSRAPSDDFDDLVTWISANQLRGRICPPGGCP